MTTNLNDDFITRAFLEGVKAQTEKAKTAGVSAYLEEPKRRPTLRPNERFLRNTIASVAHANRRTEEAEMWARRKAQLRGEGHSSGAASPEPSPSPRQGTGPSVSQAAAPDQALAGDDEELGRMLVARQVRGRGGCGPRIGSVGPVLDDEERQESAEERIKRRVGPQKPARLLGDKAEGGSSSGSSGSSDSDSESEERRRRRKRKEKEKKRKKEKRKRRKKEEKKRKEKKQRRRRSPSSSPSP